MKKKNSFPVVGLGASAGGLEAFELFFRNVPQGSEIAYIVVSHLDPGHASMLADILQRSTDMPVAEVKDGARPAKNRVYVIPPNRNMTLQDGLLRLSEPDGQRGPRTTIDLFFRSLAMELDEKALAVLLSGTGTDGTLGMRDIIGAGGATFVQDPETAAYPGMPRSAINEGVATQVLPVEAIPERLIAYANQVAGKTPVRDDTIVARPLKGQEEDAIRKIVVMLRTRAGNDFSLYKINTIKRRIERRMNILGIDDIGTYVRYLREQQKESDFLWRELLISVTSFFRDPGAFETLKRDILPHLFRNKPDDYTFRVWVPACATGEEAYSIAMLFREYMDENGIDRRMQIYATDISDDVIAVARRGEYLDNISLDVSPERLLRFFIMRGTQYRVSKELREMMVFSRHNVISDPPFTRLDLVSCRNLLIYLEPETQDQLIRKFNYSLKPGGVLFLSPSESVGVGMDFFQPLNRKWKFFVSHPGNAGMEFTGPPREVRETREQAGKARKDDTEKWEKNLANITAKALLSTYPPPSVLIDEGGNLLYVHGDTGKYLHLPHGVPKLNVLEMVSDGIAFELHNALFEAIGKKHAVIRKNLPIKTGGGINFVDISVRPLHDDRESRGLIIVSFQDVPPEAGNEHVEEGAGYVAETGKSKREEELEKEVVYTKFNLHSTIQELQTSNEELKTMNEEFQSTIEELQSTNEELEMSKEELQSVNEELVAVNTELQSKMEQLMNIENDMKNILDSTAIAVIFLDLQLRIKRFTPAATKMFRLIDTDIGRPLADITSTLEEGDFVVKSRTVIDTLLPSEQELRSSEGKWFLVKIMPYRTLDNIIAGAVVTFTDVTKLKQSEEAGEKARRYAESIIDTIREALVVLDEQMILVSASRSFYRLFNITPREAIGRSLYDLGGGEWNIPRLRELLEKILPENTSFENVEYEVDSKKFGHKKMLLNARRVFEEKTKTRLILLAMEDVTGTEREKENVNE